MVARKKKTQSGWTFPQTLRKRELHAPDCPFFLETASCTNAGKGVYIRTKMIGPYISGSYVHQAALYSIRDYIKYERLLQACIST
jgi:hypothetical protein